MTCAGGSSCALSASYAFERVGIYRRFPTSANPRRRGDAKLRASSAGFGTIACASARSASVAPCCAETMMTRRSCALDASRVLMNAAARSNDAASRRTDPPIFSTLNTRNPPSAGLGSPLGGCALPLVRRPPRRVRDPASTRRSARTDDYLWKAIERTTRHRRPQRSPQRQPQFMEPLMLRAFVPTATQRLQQGSAAVVFDSGSK